MIMLVKLGAKQMRLFLRTATFLLLCIFATACATSGEAAFEEYAAYGYLTPGPTSEPELIGIYSSVKECEAAAKEWTTRQVVGNPIFAECYPVDRN